MFDRIGTRTVRDLLDERVAQDPGRPALVVEDAQGSVRQFTYRELQEEVDRCALRLQSLGVAQGDRVMVHLRNCPEFLFVWFAAATLGAVIVPANVANTARELRFVVTSSGAALLITEPALLPIAADAVDGVTHVREVVLVRTDERPDGVVVLDDLAVSKGGPSRPAVDSEDPLEIIYTSGTTAQPKGVVLTHANCLWSGERVAAVLALDGGERCLTALPLFHVNAQSVTVLSSLTVGGTCVLLEEFSASRFWNQVRKHEATQTSLVAMQLRTLLAQPERPDDREHRLRRAFYAINVSDEEKLAFERRYGVQLINGYGLSEAMTLVTVAPVFGPRRWPSIGVATFDRRLRIVDVDGRDVPTGQVGELLVHGVPGRTIMQGYYQDEDATRSAVQDGWLHTGDYVYADDHGYIYFFDRKKDVIKRAGENVSASDVEQALQEHPDIAEAAVIGVQDPIRDEAVKAFVVPVEGRELTVEEVQEHCRSHLASFKVPTVVEFLDKLPRTSVGKIEKKALRTGVDHQASL